HEPKSYDNFSSRITTTTHYIYLFILQYRYAHSVLFSYTTLFRSPLTRENRTRQPSSRPLNLRKNLTGLFRSGSSGSERVSPIMQIGRAHVCTPVTFRTRMPSSTVIKIQSIN